MSTHPNSMLVLALTPDDLAMKTYRAIMAEAGTDESMNIKIGSAEYHMKVMVGGYDEDYQIALPDGTIYLFDFFTYGYGEKVKWSKLEAQKAELEEWSRGACERHHCTAEIYVSANYW